MKRDLVCRMEIDEASAAVTAEFQGTTYYFCAEGCRDRFSRDPERYLTKEKNTPEGSFCLPCKEAQSGDGASQLTPLELPVLGMSCASCVEKVEKGLRGTPGVREVRVDLARERAHITYDPSLVSPKVFIGAVRGLGFRVGLEETVFHVSEMTCAACVLEVHTVFCGVQGVIGTEVNLAEKTVTIMHLAGVGILTLREAVEAAGYTVAMMGEG